MSASADIEETSIELESFLSVEEDYLLDNRTSRASIEMNPLSASEDTYRRGRTQGTPSIGKGDATFQLPYHVIGMSELFITGGTKHLRAKNKTARELLKTYHESELCSSECTNGQAPWSSPSGPSACAG